MQMIRLSRHGVYMLKEETVQTFRDYGIFLRRAAQLSFRGGPLFLTWMTFLTILSLIGLRTYFNQLAGGLATTAMTDQVSWGIYIANFTFLVGMAAAAVMLVIPAYIYRNEEMHNVVIFGELLSIAAIIMCLLFVAVDIGRPDRFWHMVPVIGLFNFPISMLSWDVVALNGYLLLNVHICGYLLYMQYLGKKPNKWLYMPFVLLSILWAVSIHTVTAFLYVGLVGRPFWNAAIVAPRFLGSAFTAGPGFMIIAFQIIRRVSDYHIGDRALHILRQIVTVSLLINLFLLGCEIYKEFYSASLHASNTQYLLFGLHGFNKMVPWFWSAMVMEFFAAIILITPALAKNINWLNAACVMAIIGIWIEKGMGLIIPGFLPSPLGEIIEYFPNWNESFISIGIWAMGALLFSWMLHLALPIISGEFHRKTDDESIN